MKWIITIVSCFFSLFSFSQVYHETNQGEVRILSADSTEVLIAFHVSEFTEITDDCKYIRGLNGKRCYMYEWSVLENDTVDYKGLFVVKHLCGKIYTVWHYQSTDEGRSRLFALLEKHFE